MQPFRSISHSIIQSKAHWRNNVKRSRPLSLDVKSSSSSSWRLLDVRYSSSSSSVSTAVSTSTTGSDNLRKKDSSLDDAIEKLPSRFLRLSSHDLYDPVTHQRTDVLFDPTDGRPIININNIHAPAAAEGDVSTAASVKADYDVVAVTIHQSNERTDNHDGTRYHDVSFKDGHKATFSSDWVKVQVNRLYNGNDQDISHMIPRIPWSNMTQENLRKKDFMSVSFDDIVLSDDYESYQSRALKILYQYGILLVTCTPTHDGGAGVSALASALSGSAYKKSADASSLVHYRKCHTLGMAPTPQLPNNAMEGPFRTLYGVIWSTHSSHMPDGVSLADSSYGNGALPLHTDMTYYRDPPGLQIFTMVSTAQVGGESIFADGLAVAERMRSRYPKEFDVLCLTTRRYRSIDTSTGWHLEANGPIFKAIDRNENCTDALKLKMGVERWGAVVGVRHNDLDRLPDLPPFHVMEDDLEEQNYYSQLEEAHYVLNQLLASDEFRLEVALEPGETVVVANQRCLHGRKSFLTTKDKPRSIMGCYVSQDDLESRFRWMMQGHCTFQ